MILLNGDAKRMDAVGLLICPFHFNARRVHGFRFASRHTVHILAMRGRQMRRRGEDGTMRHGLAQRGVIARTGALLGVAAMVFVARFAYAAELEPRAYSNTPVGLNFLIAGYGYSEGGLSTSGASPIKDAKLKIHTELLAYVRTLDVWGKSGKFDVILANSQLSGTATYDGQSRERQVSGLNDPRFRISVNFYGSPALSMREFADYRQDLLIGASVQVSAPVGQYDSGKFVNIGANRWFIKPDIGISKALGPLTLELSASVMIFTKNDDFFGGQTLEQDPLYSTQAHVTYNFGNGVWGALDGTYDYGGRTTVNGVRSDDAQGNSRAGVTLAMPVNRNNSIKIYTSTGVTTRSGSDYTLGGIAWQYRWGGGL
jgi:hypothetical protein